MVRIAWPRIEIGAEMDTGIQTVWDLITDTESWPEWGPSVRAVRSVDRRIRLGSTGQVLTPFFLWLSFEVTVYEDSTFWSWKVAGFPATGHRVEEIDGTRCRLVFTLPLWAFKYLPVCRIALKRIQALLKGG